MNKLPFYLFVILLLSSCGRNSPNTGIGFPDAEQISGQILELDNGFLGRPGKMIAIDSIIVALDIDEKNVLDIIDVKNQKFLKRSGKKGTGPGECITPFAIYRINKREFAIHDLTLKTVFAFSLDSVLANDGYLPHSIAKLKNTEGMIFLSVMPVTENTIVATGIIESGRYVLADSTGKVVTSKFDYPVDPEHPATPYQAKAMAYQCKLEMHPQKKRVVSATSSAGVLEILEIDEQSPGLKKIKDVHWHNPIYKPDMTERGVSSAYSRENRFGFSDISCNEKYIHALYSGRIFKENPQIAFLGKDVYTFDWDGSPIKHYILDNDLVSICVNDSGVLYGLAETPEPVLIKYVLP